MNNIYSYNCSTDDAIVCAYGAEEWLIAHLYTQNNFLRKI